MSSKALIIPAAGSGKRMKRKTPKPFIPLKGIPILEHTLNCFSLVSGLKQLVVAANDSRKDEVEHIMYRSFSDRIDTHFVQGGTHRQQSVYNALKIIKDVDLIMVHDAVRPFIGVEQIEACIAQAERYGAAVLGVPVKDTIKKADEKQFVAKTPVRKNLWQIQTPQIFKAKIIKDAYNKATEQNFVATDDASLVEWAGRKVKIVEGHPSNIKITYPQDLKIAEFLLEQKMNT